MHLSLTLGLTHIFARAKGKINLPKKNARRGDDDVKRVTVGCSVYNIRYVLYKPPAREPKSDLAYPLKLKLLLFPLSLFTHLYSSLQHTPKVEFTLLQLLVYCECVQVGVTSTFIHLSTKSLDLHK